MKIIEKTFCVSIILAILLTMLALPGYSQVIDRDTSYTLASALRKYQDEYPYISIRRARSERVRVDTDMTYYNSGGRKLQMDIYQPTTISESLPVILLIHGGGWKTGNKSMMRALATGLAGEGYVVFAPEYRLSPEAGFPAAVEDLHKALEFIKSANTAYPADADRVTIMGCSAGGQLAALVGNLCGQDSVRHSCVSAIIDIDGILAFDHPDSREGKSAAQWLGGTVEENPETWKAASALTHAGAHSPPTLLVGSRNPRFLAGYQDYIDILDKYGTLHEVMILEDAPHSFWLFDPWYEPTLAMVASFLEVALK